MRSQALPTLLALVVSLTQVVAAKEKNQAAEAQPSAPVGWLELGAHSRALSVSESDLRKVTRHLAPRTLLPVLRTKEKRGTKIAQVRAFDLDSAKPELGWVALNSDELKPVESYPLDSELLRLLGGPYLDDFAAEHTDIARFLVRGAEGPPVLLCYVFTAPLAMAKLVIFTPNQGRFSPGGILAFPISEMQAGIISLEIRDLIGDGSDCVITKEPFRQQAQTKGTDLVIRRVAGGKFQTLWKAPIEFQNLSQYTSKTQILQPPEQNIGAPGTVTTGEVTFRPQGPGQEPVWRGKVEFFVFGREKAYDSVNIEKVCPWNGREFTPLR
jgi:hypothetical protein